MPVRDLNRATDLIHVTANPRNDVPLDSLHRHVKRRWVSQFRARLLQSLYR
jgi:hypothetical protein